MISAISSYLVTFSQIFSKTHYDMAELCAIDSVIQWYYWIPQANDDNRIDSSNLLFSSTNPLVPMTDIQINLLLWNTSPKLYSWVITMIHVLFGSDLTRTMNFWLWGGVVVVWWIQYLHRAAGATLNSFLLNMSTIHTGYQSSTRWYHPKRELKKPRLLLRRL